MPGDVPLWGTSSLGHGGLRAMEQQPQPWALVRTPYCGEDAGRGTGWRGGSRPRLERTVHLTVGTARAKARRQRGAGSIPDGPRVLCGCCARWGWGPRPPGPGPALAHDPLGAGTTRLSLEPPALAP